VIAPARPRCITRAIRGFTAVELSMVVTVIAILALLILPLFQRQTDEARVTAAEGDVREFIIALQLANAHTGLWFQVHNLDNTDNLDPAGAGQADPTLDVPVNTWNDALTLSERAALAQNWQGPYASFRRTASYSDPVDGDGLNDIFPGVWFRGNYTGLVPTGGGPINLSIDPSVNLTIPILQALSDERFPLDPWGTPYIFYGPDRYHLTDTSETRFRNGLMLSLGPDGLPGDGVPLSVNSLDRQFGIVGTGDDIARPF